MQREMDKQISTLRKISYSDRWKFDPSLCRKRSKLLYELYIRAVPLIEKKTIDKQTPHYRLIILVIFNENDYSLLSLNYKDNLLSNIFWEKLGILPNFFTVSIQLKV